MLTREWAWHRAIVRQGGAPAEPIIALAARGPFPHTPTPRPRTRGRGAFGAAARREAGGAGGGRSVLGVPRTLQVLAGSGCTCRHLEYDQHPNLTFTSS